MSKEYRDLLVKGLPEGEAEAEAELEEKARGLIRGGSSRTVRRLGKMEDRLYRRAQRSGKPNSRIGRIQKARRYLRGRQFAPPNNPRTGHYY